ncbi:MAG: class I SAM-dependent methyltransferase, partial [Bacillota bacterium]|nr:class I SAM-dependent methyltransferase [Bacillota bacterium]
MENKSSLTALISLFGRAYHVERDEPVIFCDDLSRCLMTEAEYRQIKNYMLGGIDFFAPDKKDEFAAEDDMLKWIVQTQIAPTPLARGRYCEDSLKTAVLTGTEQYVILGAGMDTFAFRNSELMARLNVFEADHPATQKDKLQRISWAGWEIPNTLHFVPMDLTQDDLAEKLLAHGYRPELKTFFSC